MPTRRCCCGPCFIYFDDFDRPDNDVELLETDAEAAWEFCDDSTDWDLIVESGNTFLTNTVANATITLKKMVGNPYAILTGAFDPVEAAIYQVLVYKGTLADACDGEDYIVEFDLSAEPPMVRIKQGGTTLAEEEFLTGAAAASFGICVTDNMIEAYVENSPIVRACGITTTKHWFALRSVTEDTKWDWIEYSDHYHNNSTCPKCRFGCFPDRALLGFQWTITDIGNSECDECPTTVSASVMIDSETTKCDAVYESEQVVIPLVNCEGPLGSDNAEITLQWFVDCTDPDNIEVRWLATVSGVAFGDPGEITILYPRGTKAIEITYSDRAIDVPFTCDGSTGACCLGGAKFSVVPITDDSCCVETEGLALEAKTTNIEDPLPPCPFLEEKICTLVSMASGKQIEVAPTTCKACTECSRPRRLNEVTMMLIPDGELRTKAAETILNDEGVGSDLAKVFGMFADTNMSCGCSGLKDILNTWTIQQIRANKSMVVGRIYSEAQKRNLPVVRSVISGLLEVVLLKNTLIG